MTEDDPSDKEAFLKLGVLLTRNGDLAGAEQALRKAAALSPQSVDPAYYLAVALFMQGERVLRRAGDRTAADKFQAAADAARRAVELEAGPYPGAGVPRAGPETARPPIGSDRGVSGRGSLPSRGRQGPWGPGEALAEDGQDAEGVRPVRKTPATWPPPAICAPPGAGPPSCGSEADVTEARTGAERWKPSREREQLRCWPTKHRPRHRDDGRQHRSARAKCALSGRIITVGDDPDRAAQSRGRRLERHSRPDRLRDRRQRIECGTGVARRPADAVRSAGSPSPNG